MSGADRRPDSRDRARMVRWIAASALGVGVLVAIAAAWIDRPLATACRNARLSKSPALQFATEAGEGMWWFIAGGLVLAGAAVRKRHDLARWAFAMIVAQAAAGISVNLLKLAIGRSRPKLFLEQGIFTVDPFTYGYDYNSFPSGHATTCAAGAMVLALALPRWRWPILAAGVAIALTRVAIHAHYLGDVVAGLALGAAMAVATVRVWKFRWPASAPVPLR